MDRIRLCCLTALLLSLPVWGARTLSHPPIITSVTISTNNKVGDPYRAPVDSPHANWKHYWKAFILNLSNLGTTPQTGTATITLKAASLISYGPPLVNITPQICFRRYDPAGAYNVAGVYARKTNLSFPSVITLPFVIAAGENFTEAIALEALGPIPIPEGGTPTLFLYATLSYVLVINEDRGAVTGSIEVAGLSSSYALDQTIQSVPLLLSRVEMLNGGRPF